MIFIAKLILKAPYYKRGHKTEDGRGRGGYAEYIATREGVELLRGGMVNYIGQRKGSCGLFSDEGVSVDLAKVSQEIDNHSGNVWALIFSLKRGDAERLGYNSAAQWMHLLRSRRNDIAKAMHIAPENLRWYAAYHNKETNPHAHMMVWSQNPREPYLSQAGIHDIKKVMASDIFRQELLSVYRGQTQARDDLKETFRAKMRELTAQIRAGGNEISPELYQKFALLCGKIASHKGKKVYGYLNKSTKQLTNEIVKLLSADGKIAELYDLWYRCQCEVYRTYTDAMPEKIPLEENKEFKSVRNEVVRAAAEILSLQRQPLREMPEEKMPEEDLKLLEIRADFGDVDALIALGRHYYEKEDDADEAEYLWKIAADKESAAAMYLIYKGYRDGKFTDKPSDKMKYLRMAADKNHAYAEYELAMQTDKRKPNVKLSYLMRAAEHGCTAAEYEIGKLYYENGQTEQGLAHLEKAAGLDLWARTQVGLFYCYTRDDWEHGMELLTSAAEENYAPAQEAVRNIQSGLNAQIFTGLCDLFYYAANIIDERAEEIQAPSGEPVISRRQRREEQAKRDGVVMQM